MVESSSASFVRPWDLIGKAAAGVAAAHAAAHAASQRNEDDDEDDEGILYLFFAQCQTYNTINKSGLNHCII